MLFAEKTLTIVITSCLPSENHDQVTTMNHSSSRRKSTPKMSKITPKSLLKQTLITLITVFLICLILNTVLLSPFPSSAFDSNPNPNSNPNPKVKLYMYELPRKFTYGVIRSYTTARMSDVNVVSPSDYYNISEIKYPGNQHSAEWYLFSDLMNSNSNSPVARVFDPEEADLFYVPFFSSLSLVVKPIRPGNDNSNSNSELELEYSDERMQDELVEWLDKQLYWTRNNGWDHVFIAQDPNALYRIIDRIRNGILLVSDFGRLRVDQASLVKDVILPYSHRINSFHGDVGLENRNSLLFFMGNRYRKEGGKIRDILFQILENEENVVIKHGAQSRESRRAATQGMHTSKFCLHPAGDTPSACRLFDAIVSLCVPVIISDQIELPFEDVIDYKKIAVFVETSSAVKPRFLVNLLRNVSEKKLLEFQLELKKVKHYFEYEDPNGTVNEIWRQVSLKLPLVKLIVNRDKRLVRKELLQPDCSCLCSNSTGPFSTL